MISCEKAVLICNKKQYKEASWKERGQLLLHLLVCKTCMTFSRKNNKLTSIFEKSQLQCLTEQDKRQMKKRLKNQG